MKTNILHTAKWQNERINTLALGYCFSSITVDQKGNPQRPGQCDTDVG
jgi:hypothetical protein